MHSLIHIFDPQFINKETPNIDFINNKNWTFINNDSIAYQNYENMTSHGHVHFKTDLLVIWSRH